MTQSQSLSTLARVLEKLGRSLDLQEGLAALAEFRPDPDELLGRVRFSERSYRPTLLSSTGGYQLYAVGWLPGQRTTVHDHGGSDCAVRVVRGEATEIRFRENALTEGVLPEAVQVFKAGEVFGVSGSVHLIADLYGEPLVTLHLYSNGSALIRNRPWYGTQPIDGPIAL